MNPSFYNILVNLEQSSEYDFIMNGHTGALDLIQKSTAKALNNGRFQDIENETLDNLKKRGYITTKTVEEERAYVAKIIETIHGKKKNKKTSSFMFIVTNNCNFRCSYCFENTFSEKGSGWTKSTFTKEMADRAYDAMLEIEPNRERHSDNIYLYGGEPLLEENYSIVKYIIDEGKKRNYKFYAISNGYDLDAYINLLGIGKIDGVQITIDGMEENHNNRRKHYKNNDSFSKIINNLKLAVKTDASIVVRVNSDKSNFNDIQHLIELFEENQFFKKDNFHVVPANTYRNCISLDNSDESFTRKGFTQEIINLREANKSISKYIGDITEIGNLLHRCIKKDDYFEFKPFFCGAVNGMRLFDPEGNMYSCWETIGLKDHIVGNYINGISYSDNREKWDNRIITRMKQCSNCKYALICAGGCPGKLATSGKDIYKSNCEDFPAIFSKMVNHYYNMELKDKD